MKPTLNINSRLRTSFESWFRFGTNSIRRTNNPLSTLVRLPYQAKSELVYFYMEGNNSLRGNPYATPIKILVSKGIAYRGPERRRNNAPECYITIKPEFWKLMDEWKVSDPDVGLILKEEYFSVEGPES